MFSPKPCEDIVNKDIIFMIILDVSTSIAYLLRKVYTSSAAFFKECNWRDFATRFSHSD